ncbi:MAG: DMT family transporter [Candidatus Midichloria sp.]|nr:MAG: DMT family transporter [Candidatus Midichloria sp.]
MKQQHSLYGILFMLVNTLALAGLDIAVKILRQDLHAGIIVFLYKFSLLIIILPWVLKDGLKRLKTQRIMSHMLRSLLSVAGALCFYHGLYFVNMADAAALENLQYLIVAIFGIMFFSEEISISKIAAIILAFIGAIIVVNPEIISEFGTINIKGSRYNKGYILILIATSFWACNTITVKLLSSTEHNKTQMFYLLLTASILSIPPAFIKWSKITIWNINLSLIPEFIDLSSIDLKLDHLLLIGFIAACYFIHGIMYFNALKSELSVVIPFRYTKLMFSAFLGWLFFAEQHSNFSYIGYTLIIAAGLLLVRSQMQKISKKKEEIAA